MALLSGFFNSINKDRVYNAEFLAMFHSSIISNGIYPNPSTNLQVTESTGMTTIVKKGKGWINGHFVIVTEDFPIIHDIADGTLSRIDRIVLRQDTAGRLIDIAVKKGILSQFPIVPTIQRDIDFHELVLGDVFIKGGTIDLYQKDITDHRLNTELCGITHGVVQQVDTTTLFNQYESWFTDYSVTKSAEFLVWQNNIQSGLENWIIAQQDNFLDWRQAEDDLYNVWLQGKKDDFDAWFLTIKDILDTNAAGNLLNLIDDHKDASMPHKFLLGPVIYKYGMAFNPNLQCVSFIYEEE